jgi:putative dimethyl sulfoxide reductase chaperone
MLNTTNMNEEEKSRMGTRERQNELQAQAHLYGFIARCLEEEADRELIQLLRGELQAPLESLGLRLDERFLSSPMDVLIEALAEEYTGLFVAPGCVSPYASVFETGCMYKEPADRAVEAYREAGWEYQRRMSGEFPDHIGTMLGFCGLLADAEAERLAAGELRRADELKGMRERFLVDQLGGWAPGWCHLAAEAALHPFYRELLKLTEALLWSELAQIVDRRRMRELAELNRREPKRLDYDADFRKASGL